MQCVSAQQWLRNMFYINQEQKIKITSMLLLSTTTYMIRNFTIYLTALWIYIYSKKKNVKRYTFLIYFSLLRWMITFSYIKFICMYNIFLKKCLLGEMDKNHCKQKLVWEQGSQQAEQPDHSMPASTVIHLLARYLESILFYSISIFLVFCYSTNLSTAMNIVLP